MAQAIIEIVNDSGTSLINGTQPNYALWYKGVTRTTGAAGMVLIARVDTVRPPGEFAPLVCFKTDRRIFLWQSGGEGNTFRYTVGIEGSLGEAVDIEYYVFRDIRLNEPAGTGLVVMRDEHNKIIFDSDAKMCNIADFATVPVLTTYTKQLDPTRDYAITNCAPAVRVNSSGSPGGWHGVWASGGAVKNGVFTVTEWFYRNVQNTPPFNNYRDPNSTFMVMDVTNF